MYVEPIEGWGYLFPAMIVLKLEIKVKLKVATLPLLRQTWPQETEENEEQLKDCQYGKQTPRGATRKSLQESFLGQKTQKLGKRFVQSALMKC